MAGTLAPLGKKKIYPATPQTKTFNILIIEHTQIRLGDRGVRGYTQSLTGGMIVTHTSPFCHFSHPPGTLLPLMPHNPDL